MHSMMLIKRLTQRCLGLFRHKNKYHKPLAQGDLPPFYALEAALHSRVRTWKGLFIAVSAVLLAVVIGQQRIIFHKLFQKMNEQVIIVPGSPEFYRVRPGQIPDESVFLFAEYVAANLGNFSHRNVTYHFGKIAEHMHPIARGRFETSFAERLKDWTERKVDQSFAYEPVKRFDLTTDQHGPKYVTAVTGTRTQYVEGHEFQETREVLLIEFRPRGGLSTEKPFIFEIESVNWVTPEQYDVLRRAAGFAHVARIGAGKHEI
jgi:hypothetical protein